jgi:hypothetical protein
LDKLQSSHTCTAALTLCMSSCPTLLSTVHILIDLSGHKIVCAFVHPMGGGLYIYMYIYIYGLLGY